MKVWKIILVSVCLLVFAGWVGYCIGKAHGDAEICRITRSSGIYEDILQNQRDTQREERDRWERLTQKLLEPLYECATPEFLEQYGITVGQWSDGTYYAGISSGVEIELEMEETK